MDLLNFYNKKIGILGGGQLGKMLCASAANWHIQTMVLNPTIECPASLVCKNVYSGNYNDYETVYRFGKLADIITIEIENVNTEALIKLSREGKTVHPNPLSLHIIQDKGLQKDFFLKNNLKSSPYILCENKEKINELIKTGKISFPFVQKLRKAGYDGKGVAVINTADDLHKMMDAPCVIEQKVKIKKELSVIAARDIDGNVSCFAPVEMIFHEEANLVKYLICPAQISEQVVKNATLLATKTIKEFDIVGILAVEMFLDENDELLINEVAPRPHNSGHHTIESAFTSQYEQQLRAILGLSLGSTEMILPSLMLNILGEPGYKGTVKYEGLEKCMEIKGAKIHLYGKTETAPYRKMGHITILDDSVENAKNKAEYIGKYLKVIA
ncbi:MAG: 5-(carboxyamino)imidazole ribonucleotide synthase [Bacteroidota bacterium]|nr:5-(carboxyamino)imidazole ribonucleotide synthase [Bacteroidota bacterium]